MDSAKEKELLHFALKGDQHAINCAEIIFAASQTLDDIWDKDKEVTGAQAASMVLNLTVDLVRNPFYQKHQFSMVHIIERAVMRWVEANDLEVTGEEDLLRIAYIIRSSTTDAVIEMAYLLGDRQHGRTAASVLRKAIYSDNESFAQYMAAFTEKPKAAEFEPVEE